MRFKAMLNRTRVTRIGKDSETILIPLPRELWRVVEGGCSCGHCGEVAYWDTLAVSAKNETPGDKYTWTVHAPELHK